MDPIRIEINITRTAVIKTKILFEKIFKFKKFPNCPPISTASKRYQYPKTSFNTSFFVSCPIIPDRELIRINIEAKVTMCLGFAALAKKSIGLKNIPPPIPTTPDINPSIAPIIIEITAAIIP